MSKYFSPAEFKHCTPACDISQMDPAFLDLMDQVREEAGIPMVMNSAYRSPSYEKAHGRSGEGDHPHGMGIDFRCNTGQNRYKIVRAALKCGVRRIGVAKTYIHLGAYHKCPQEVIWHYYGE